MARSNRTRNRLLRIKRRHLNAILHGPNQVVQSNAPKNGFRSGVCTKIGSAKHDRPLGHTFAIVATTVYRHKIKTDKKAKY